ncbi:kinase-like domain-containing protein [Pilobolus umbonatus]|nr:kinase-like domain-containing protein [Pilobolus umbonatus]
MQTANSSLNFDHSQHNYISTHSPDSTTKSNPSSRKQPIASLFSTTKSSRPMRDRRRSSGALSTHSQQQKPKKYIGEYMVGKTLGKGASGRVKLGIHRTTGEQVAIKIISKSHLAANPAIEKAVKREIAIMKLIHHPNVMSLIDVIDDPASSDLYLILEYVEGGELFEYLVSKGRLSENEARHHFQQIILGLDYCHHHLICHRDLKPENLLLNGKNNIKIADFGMASLQPLGSMLETSCGSPHYASPEIVAGMPYNGSACDIWSCGVILYALLTGHLPFDDENIRQLLKKVKSGKYIMPENISRSAQDLISQILVIDPARRYTMDQIMAHPWFCESEPINMYMLPVPPTALEIGQPVSNASEIDDRILETIKFLWGETNNEAIIRALVQKEHNMQKVVYVLLQQHAERYWQADHDDETDDDVEDTYSDTPRRRYRTLGHRAERDRRCLSMVDPQSSSSKKKHMMGDRSSSPWLSSDTSKHGTVRRYSAATIRINRSPINLDELPANPPLPIEEKKSKMKKSETFYARFVKNVLSTTRRQTAKNKNTFESNSIGSTDGQDFGTSLSSSKPTNLTMIGTLRRKNPFTKSSTNNAEFSISPDSIDSPQSSISQAKSNVRPMSHVLQRNKIDPSEDLEDFDQIQQPTKSTDKSTLKSSTVSSKRLSLRLSNAFRGDSTVSSKKFGFTLGSGSKKQRKQLDLSLFHTEKAESKLKQESNLTDSALIPPPMLSDGSTLSNSSSTSSNSQNNGYLGEKGNSPSTLKPEKNGTDSSTNDVSGSVNRLNSSHSTLTQPQQTRPATPSLLSNSSTINSPGEPTVSTIPSQPAKSSWLSNLFFFKQPKVCSIVLYSDDAASILRTLHKLMNKETEARFYEKFDRTGVPRYKAEIKTKIDQGSKVRQVKCRIDMIISKNHTCVVQFTQQQGDAILLTSTIQQIRENIMKEYPCPSEVQSFKQSNSVTTSDTLIEEE